MLINKRIKNTLWYSHKMEYSLAAKTDELQIQLRKILWPHTAWVCTRPQLLQPACPWARYLTTPYYIFLVSEVGIITVSTSLSLASNDCKHMRITYNSTSHIALKRYPSFQEGFLVFFRCGRSIFSLCKSKNFQVVSFLSILSFSTIATTLDFWSDSSFFLECPSPYPLSCSYVFSNVSFSLKPPLTVLFRVVKSPLR